MARSACLLSQTLRIYLEDTDAGGIVYHASWLRFFERARTDWLRTLGIEQSSFTPQSGISFVVRDMHIEFLRPGRLDQQIRSELRLLERRRASLSLCQQAFDYSSGQELVRADVRIAVLNASTGKAGPLPRALMDTLSSPDQL
ncbi:MAG: YbgC/FadM family acyl-CoA thioesterase [Betaproteobacteria bacterium]